MARKFLAGAAGLLALAGASWPALAAGDDTQLVCAGPFAQDATERSLIEAFGANNVKRATLDGPEGSTFESTIVFPDDPKRRLDIVWWDEDAHARPSTIIVDNGSDWKSPGGVALGATLDEVTAINGKPFSISGFGWDYGGAASFTEGALAGVPGGCFVALSFEPGNNELGAEFDALMGDRQIASDDPLMKKAAPRVISISIGYPAP